MSDLNPAHASSDATAVEASTPPASEAHAPQAESVTVTAAGLTAAYDDHAQALYRYCLRMCGDATEAEDLLSVVFLEAWRTRRAAFMVDHSMAPWLYGIARNTLRNSRRASRRQRAALERFRAHDVEQLTIPDHADAVAARHHSLQTREAIDAAFEQLSSKDREAAELCLVAGMSNTDAAIVLGVAQGTVKSRLWHSRRHLRKLLQSGEVPTQIEPGVSTGHVPVKRGPRAPVSKATTTWGNQ